MKREQFKPQNVEKDDSQTELLYAQVLRTQPEYQEENILALYNQNFKMATSYIYFENQYFRFLHLLRHYAIAVKSVKTLPNVLGLMLLGCSLFVSLWLPILLKKG